MSETDDSHDDGHSSTASDHPRIQPWKDPDRLRRLYHEEDLTQSEIADRFGIDDSTLSYWFKRFGIETGYTTDSNEDGGDS